MQKHTNVVYKIIEVVENHYNQSGLLTLKTRESKALEARNMAIYILRQKMKLTYSDLGQIFERTHASMLSAFDTFEVHIRLYYATREDYNNILAKLYNL